MARGSFVAVAALLLCVGCSADQKGAAPPPPVPLPTTASPSSAPTVAATPFVSTADEAGAFAFVREYFHSVNDANRSGTWQVLAPFRESSCSCVRVETELAEIYGNGGHVEGADLKLGELIAGQSGPAFFKVTAPFVAPDDTVIRADGSRRSEKGGKGYYYVSLVREQSHWVIDDIQMQFLK